MLAAEEDAFTIRESAVRVLDERARVLVKTSLCCSRRSSGSRRASGRTSSCASTARGSRSFCYGAPREMRRAHGASPMSAVAAAIAAPAPPLAPDVDFEPRAGHVVRRRGTVARARRRGRVFRLPRRGRATAYIVLLHVVFTVAHHLPTFIRVYGDVDLFRRFKWTFLWRPCSRSASPPRHSRT